MSNYTFIFSFYFYFTVLHVQPNYGSTGLKHVAYMQIHTSIDKMQSNTTFNICIAKRFFYISSLNNDMFQPLYQPSSGCTLSYYKANYTIYNVFVNKISCTSINRYTTHTQNPE
jgi:hypothetical protein